MNGGKGIHEQNKTVRYDKTIQLEQKQPINSSTTQQQPQLTKQRSIQNIR